MHYSSIAAAAVSILASNAHAQNSSSLPTVDLGYNLQQASSYNNTGRYYSFSNIRYAAPPPATSDFELLELQRRIDQQYKMAV